MPPAWAACARWRGAAVGRNLVPGQQCILGRNNRTPPRPQVQARANRGRVALQQRVMRGPYARHHARELHVSTCSHTNYRNICIGQFVNAGFLQPAKCTRARKGGQQQQQQVRGSKTGLYARRPAKHAGITLPLLCVSVQVPCLSGLAHPNMPNRPPRTAPPRKPVGRWLIIKVGLHMKMTSLPAPSCAWQWDPAGAGSCGGSRLRSGPLPGHSSKPPASLPPVLTVATSCHDGAAPPARHRVLNARTPVLWRDAQPEP